MQTSQPIQLHVVENADPAAGGEGLAALRYGQAIALAGGRVVLVSTRIAETTDDQIWEMGPFEQLAIPARSGLGFLPRLMYQYRFLQKLCADSGCDVIHLHGMWSPLLAVAALVARKRKVPLVISSHGCLEPWAIKHKYYKKIFALRTYQGLILRSAAMFVATAVQELNSIRALGFRQPVAVLPNGVDVGDVRPKKDACNQKVFLFLSRLHPKKGLLDLVEAWSLVRRGDWKIVIAGGDEAGYRAKVENLISSKGLEADFEFVGFVDGALKQSCFDRADVFVLPTYSENFGIAIAEALANELPVITTTGAPWSDLIERNCGWWVSPGVIGISGALTSAMNCELPELRAMGQRGRRLVIEKYSWEKIGKEAFEVANWLVGTTERMPESINVAGL